MSAVTLTIGVAEAVDSSHREVHIIFLLITVRITLSLLLHLLTAR